MIVAMVRCYNNADDLHHCLASLKDKVDRILVLDGYFPLPYRGHRYDFENNGHSRDHPEQVAKDFHAEYVPGPDGGYAKEVDKLNRVLELVQPSDWVLSIDPDERLVGDLREAIKGQEDYADFVPLRIYHPNMDKITFYARVFRYREGVRWEKHEHTLVYPGARYPLFMGTVPRKTYLLHTRKP